MSRTILTTQCSLRRTLLLESHLSAVLQPHRGPAFEPFVLHLERTLVEEAEKIQELLSNCVVDKEKDEQYLPSINRQTPLSRILL